MVGERIAIERSVRHWCRLRLHFLHRRTHFTDAGCTQGTLLVFKRWYVEATAHTLWLEGLFFCYTQASREAAYCYVNPPEGEDDVPVDALAVTEGTERTDAIFLSSDMFDALFGAAPEGLVCLVPELDVPGLYGCMAVVYSRSHNGCSCLSAESIQVDVCCATQATMTTDSLKASLDAQFGTGSRVDARVDAVAAAFNAARPNAEEDAAVSSWMTRYLAASTCPYTPVWRGMRFAVNSVEFTVAAVTPSSPARVGPSTVFCIRYV